MRNRSAGRIRARAIAALCGALGIGALALPVRAASVPGAAPSPACAESLHSARAPAGRRPRTTPTIRWLEQVIALRNVASIEELLPLLPEEYRSEYVLMFASRSTQDASPLSPRVILSGEDARLLMAFNGDPGQRGFDRLELIEFDDAEARFRFYEAARGPSGRLEIHPGRDCETCHRADPRPNWAPYNHWPGAYGELRDQLDEPQRARAREFLQLAERSARYRALPGLAAGMESGERNSRFTERVFQLNYRRVARLMQAHPMYKAFKFAALGSTGCERFADFFPPGRRPPSERWDRFASRQKGLPSPWEHLMKAEGIDDSDWTTMIEGVPAQPFEGNAYGTPGFPQWEFAGVLMDRDPELHAFGQVEDYTYAGTALRLGKVTKCQELAKRSAWSFLRWEN